MWKIIKIFPKNPQQNQFLKEGAEKKIKKNVGGVLLTLNILKNT